MTRTLSTVVLAFAGLLVGCASSVPLADRIVYPTSEPPPPAITPAEMWSRKIAPPPPELDISEEERREWFRNNNVTYRADARSRGYTGRAHQTQYRQAVQYVEVEQRPWWQGPEPFYMVLAGLSAYWAKRSWDHNDCDW